MSNYCKFYTYLTDHPIKLHNTPWTLIGDSRAARNTMFYIPELDIAFDAGIQTDLKPAIIFISHSHLDHTRELTAYLLEPNPELIVFVPKPSHELITNYITAGICMTKHYHGKPDTVKLKCKISDISIPKDAKSIIYPDILTIKNIKFKLEVFKCTHTIATHGYGLIEYRKCLNPIYDVPEYQDPVTGKPDPKKLAKLKQSGCELNIITEIPQICYLLDTDHKMLYKDKDNKYPNTNISKYNNIIIECTFISDDHKQEAKETGHMLWSNLKPFILANPQVHFILCHFSMRYKDQEIKDFFDKENIKNISYVVY